MENTSAINLKIFYNGVMKDGEYPIYSDDADYIISKDLTVVIENLIESQYISVHLVDMNTQTEVGEVLLCTKYEDLKDTIARLVSKNKENIYCE